MEGGGGELVSAITVHFSVPEILPPVQTLFALVTCSLSFVRRGAQRASAVEGYLIYDSNEFSLKEKFLNC